MKTCKFRTMTTSNNVNSHPPTSGCRTDTTETTSSSGDEHVARCVALEKAYVHDVYEQFNETSKARPWPKIQQFLQDLEPGSLVCDVGCGSGKYLNVNQSVFKVGVDRCSRLIEVAREKDNEVLICDNLSLPFRDESFDAVLSVAVIHHFATTERRVCALKELARLLRIGGKLIISVWAMEQRHKKFESQDVLVPWHRPQNLSTLSLELTSTTNTSEEDMLPPYHAYTQTSDSDSNRSLRYALNGFRKRGRTKHKGRSIDPNNCSSSPSSSSLSSPNETCYSFVRRALQKLAGGRRSASRHRPWFLDSWSYCSKEQTNQYHYQDPRGDENEDIHDLPIELRRIEEGELLQCSKQNSLDLYKSGQKSKSLSDIRTVKSESLIRSVSNVSSLKNFSNLDENALITKQQIRNIPEISEETCTNHPTIPTLTIATSPTVTTIKAKPKLVKQKQSLNEEDEDFDKPLNQRDVVEALPNFQFLHSHYGMSQRTNKVFKQSSMNEELLNIDRLREKERVKKNIQKQASLNEDLIYRRYRTLDSLRDSLLSVSTSKRFQLLKNGFTNKLKTSTTNIEKVTSASIKNGFVRILQSWKTETTMNDEHINDEIILPKPQHITTVTEEIVQSDEPQNERRHSREDGSDSSKDSSLQSDTSVDSEDSFASVIFVPKQDSQELTSPTPLSPAPTSPRIKSSSGPTSPRLKQSSCPTSPRIKQMPLSVYPLLKQPTSPKSAQLKQIASSGGKVLIYSQSTPCTKSINGNAKKVNSNSVVVDETVPSNTLSSTAPLHSQKSEEPSSTVDITKVESTPSKIENISLFRASNVQSATSSTVEKYKSLAEKYKLQQIPAFRSFAKPFSADKTRTDRLQQIRDLLNQRPDFGKRIQTAAKRTSSSAFPILRRGSVQITGKTESIAKSLPRLLSLELFNPETDDMDSDSSGISSPDSVDSVISVEIQDSHLKNKKDQPKENSPKTTSPIEEFSHTTDNWELSTESNEESKSISPSAMSLFEAAANVANSLDSAVGAVIQSSPHSKHKEFEQIEQSKILEVVTDNGEDEDFNTNNDAVVPNESKRLTLDDNKTECTRFTFDNIPPLVNENTTTQYNNCLQHLAEFAEQISESVLKQIDEYQEENRKQDESDVAMSSDQLTSTSLDKFNDPYIHKLNEEIKDLTKLSAELTKERNLYLTKLNNTSTTNTNTTTVTQLNNNNLDNLNICDNSNHVNNLAQKHVMLTSSISDHLEQGSCQQQLTVNNNNTKLAQLLPGLSQDSNSDAGDISERTASSNSYSDWSHSRADTTTTGSTAGCGSTADVCCSSTASLNSSTAGSYTTPPQSRRLTDRRSTSEDIPEVSRSRAPLIRQHASFQEPLNLEQNNQSLNISLSDTSQESLPSDSAGGAITYHRYYHVFREGELDQLIERYVENLHIISSYYDHASWCVVAEKVQVWTI